MKALSTIPDRKLEVREIPAPTQPAADHVIVQMEASAINPGDITFLRTAPLGPVGARREDVWGVSGAGKIIAAGSGIPASHVGKKIATYRSLKPTSTSLGTWSEVNELHIATCVVLPDEVDAIDYCGSVVNLITPYAFLKQAQDEGHKGILATAGTSATGIAMLGFAQLYNMPIISIVRNQASKKQLQELGAEQVLCEDSPTFETDLAKLTEELKTTAIFEGLGGMQLARILACSAQNSTVYSYGYLNGMNPLQIQMSLLMAKSLTIKSFSNFKSPTVSDPAKLTAALAEIGRVINRPHFKTKLGQVFTYEQINQALEYKPVGGAKAILKAK